MISLKKLLTKLLQAAPPVGTISSYAGASDPSSEWAICDGRALSRTTYATLFGIIGTTYGSGDGSNTFNIPDLQGRVAVGRLPEDSTATEVNFGTLGNKKGSKYLQNHNHSFTANFYYDGSSSQYTTSSKYGMTWAQRTTEGITYRGDGSSQNIQPSLVVNYIIYLG